MKIDLNKPGKFTKEQLCLLIASEDDSRNTQFRVTTDGFLFLSLEVGNQNIEDIKFRLETNVAGNRYVGKIAAGDDDWVNRIYNVINENWPNPISTYIDDY